MGASGKGILLDEEKTGKKPKKPLLELTSLTPQLTAGYIIENAFNPKLPVESRISAIRELKEKEPLTYLIYDVDRDVRKAAIQQLKELGGQEYLKTAREKIQARISGLAGEQVKTTIKVTVNQIIGADLAAEQEFKNDKTVLFSGNATETDAAFVERRERLRAQMIKRFTETVPRSDQTLDRVIRILEEIKTDIGNILKKSG